MNKKEFLKELRKGLCKLPKHDIEERLSFYGEMIDDRIEEGLSEEEAVLGVGPIDKIISQITGEAPVLKKKPKKTISTLEIALLILGSPIWLSLFIAAFAILFAVYVVLWSVVVALWSVAISLAACIFGGIVAAAVFFFGGNTVSAIAVLGAGVCCAGLSIFMFLICNLVTKGIISLTKKIASGIKNLFTKWERK